MLTPLHFRLTTNLLLVDVAHDLAALQLQRVDGQRHAPAGRKPEAATQHLGRVPGLGAQLRVVLRELRRRLEFSKTSLV